MSTPQWSIIPDFDRLSESVALAERWGAAFEYNDFYHPAVYEDPAELSRRMAIYRALARDRSRDTLHGVFLDIAIASSDRTIRAHCRSLVAGSVAVASELGLRGAVFHTGLISGLNYGAYRAAYLAAAEEVFRPLCVQYPTVNIYMENTFEKDPEVFVELMARMRDLPNFRLCLDYAHAALTPTPLPVWVDTLAPHIGHIHLNDNDLAHDLHAVPGDAAIDFAAFRDRLAAAGVSAPILLELKGIENQERALHHMTAIYGKGEAPA